MGSHFLEYLGITLSLDGISTMSTNFQRPTNFQILTNNISWVQDSIFACTGGGLIFDACAALDPNGYPCLGVYQLVLLEDGKVMFRDADRHMTVIRLTDATAIIRLMQEPVVVQWLTNKAQALLDRNISITCNNLPLYDWRAWLVKRQEEVIKELAPLEETLTPCPPLHTTPATSAKITAESGKVH